MQQFVVHISPQLIAGIFLWFFSRQKHCALWNLSNKLYLLNDCFRKHFFWRLISSLEGSKINFLSRTKLSFTMSIGESFTELKCLVYFFGPVNSRRQKNINIGLASGQQKSFIAILIKQYTFKWWIRNFFFFWTEESILECF